MRKKISHFLGISALALSLFVSVPANAQELEVTDVQLTEQTEDIPMATNGWVTNSDGTFSYYEDGTKVTYCVKQIGSKYYGFDYNGVMYSDRSFYYNGDYYRAKKNGDLYQNSWYYDEYEEYHYYCSDCTEAENEIVTIGGKKYYFDYSGEMVTEGAFTCDGVSYIADANGVCTVLKNNTWGKVGDHYVYSQNGTVLKNTIALIGGKYYGFDYSGFMYADTIFSMYDSEEGESYYYAADANGVLKKSTWVERYDDWYYIGSDYRAYAEGFYTIGGKSYYFNSWGEMVVNCTYTIDGVVYGFDENGAYKKLVDNSWNLVGKNYFYMKNGEILQNCVALIGGKYYGFNYNGVMYTSTTFSVYNSEIGEYIYYRAKKDGVLYCNTWYLDENGYYEYYGSDCAAYTDGVYTIGGKKYAFDYSGDMYTDRTVTLDGKNYVCQENGVAIEIKDNKWTLIDGDYYYSLNGTILRSCVSLINGNYYGFDYNGKMYADQTFYVGGEEYRAKADGILYRNSWYLNEYGRYQYYGSNAELYDNGVYTIGKKQYAFSNDYLLCNNIMEDSTGCYYTDANGVATKIVSGWKQVKNSDGELKWVYVKDNKFLSGAQNIDGVYYYFSGQILHESEGIVYSDYKYYFTKADGKIVTTKGWKLYNGYWYYIDADYSLHNGLLTLNGKSYYFEPQMVANDAFLVIDGVPYSAKGSDGVLTKITTNGVYTDYIGKYYVQNGKVFTGWKLLNGYWYYFNNNMIIDRSYEIDGKYYYFDDQGKMLKNCWIGYNKYYATASGELATGKTVIGGKTYYFSDNGYLTKGYANDEEPLVYYNGDGTYKTMNFKEGWNKYNGAWYYYHDSYIYHSSSITIDGKNYAFDQYGRMITNQMVNGRYYGSDGIAKTGWVQYGDEWYYYDKYSYMVHGLTEIDGNKYYFAESDGSMCTTEAVIDGQKYTFYSDGRVKSIGSFSTGWYSINSEAVYYKNGELYTGWLGNSYIEYGKKQYNRVIVDYDSDDEKAYYVDNTGNYVKSKYIEGERIYAKADGTLASEEWIKLNGSWYYFGGNNGYYYGSYCACNGAKVIDGVTYIFENHKMIKQFSTVKDGWQKVGNNWYYGRNGRFVVYGEYYIDGAWYQFDEGRMIKEQLYDISYIDKDGKISFDTGWKSIFGSWYYFDADGTTHEGWLTIGSNTYYCAYGRIVTGYYTIERELYYFDANGVCKGKRGVENGWYSAGGNWYYFVDGKLVMYDTMVIDGATYGFTYNGYMLKNRVASVGYGVMYYFGADGKKVTKQGIYTDMYGGTVYVDASGRAHVGHLIINGVHKFMTATREWAY